MRQSNDHPGALVISWGLPQPGREQAALQMLGRTLEFFRELERAGRISAVRPYGLTSGSYSQQQGLLVVEGTVDQVWDVSWTKEFKTLFAQAGSLVQNLSRNYAVGGDAEAVQGPAAVYGSAVAALDAG